MFSPAEAGFLDDAGFHSTALGPGYDRPFQFDPSVREPKTIQLYRHLNLKSCVWTFDAFYDMTELIDVCGGSVTADFQVGTLFDAFCDVTELIHVCGASVTADFQVGALGYCAWVLCQLCSAST